MGVITKQKTAIELERHEAKYIVHPDQLPEIRDFIRPFCVADDNAEGGLPEYLVTTLQLDSPNLALYAAKEIESLNHQLDRAKHPKSKKDAAIDTKAVHARLRQIEAQGRIAPAVFCLDAVGRIGEELVAEGVDLVCFGRKPGRDWKVGARIARAVRARPRPCEGGRRGRSASRSSAPCRGSS